jgi:hypothetical protein
VVCRYVCHPETGCGYDTLWMELGRRGKLQTETNGGLGNCQQMGGAPQCLHFLLYSTDENSSDINSVAMVLYVRTDFAGTFCPDADTSVYICAYITVHWSILLDVQFTASRNSSVCTALNTEHIVLTRTHKTQLLQPNLLLTGIRKRKSLSRSDLFL